MKIQRYVMIPCQKSQGGKVNPHANDAVPHGFHHIVKAYQDGSYTTIATVHHSFHSSNALQLMNLLAGALPSMKDCDFYKKAAAAGVKEHSNNNHKRKKKL